MKKDFFHKKAQLTLTIPHDAPASVVRFIYKLRCYPYSLKRRYIDIRPDDSNDLRPSAITEYRTIQAGGSIRDVYISRVAVRRTDGRTDDDQRLMQSSPHGPPARHT